MKVIEEDLPALLRDGWADGVLLRAEQLNVDALTEVTTLLEDY